MDLKNPYVDKRTLIEMYRDMVRIRRFEEKLAELYAQARLPGFMHTCVGQEAVAVGVCANLRKDDYITTNHRPHGHCIAKGAPLDKMFAELMGRVTGTNKGKGGSMHIMDFENGNLGANGIVGSAMPIAVGAGLSAKLRGTDQVCVSFFGDGAANEGSFHESINLAAAWDVPVVFVCSNNLYATWSRFTDSAKIDDIAKRAASYGIDGIVVDGMDVTDVYTTTRDAITKARKKKMPTLIECKTYRFAGHYLGDPDPPEIRPEAEKAAWEAKCPIRRLKGFLVSSRIASKEEVREIDEKVVDEVEDAVKTAEAASFPPTDEALKDVFSETPLYEEIELEPSPSENGRELSFAMAINEALKEEMARDETIFTYGEGFMGERGGPYGVVKGLQHMFGPERVMDSPMSEFAMVGCACGAAITGMKPVVEIMFNDWIGLAIDQIVNQITKIRYVSAGQVKVPVVIRTNIGITRSHGAHHSQCLESWFLHMPGIRVIIPSTPYDAKGLLKAALRDNNPSVYMEHKKLYRVKGPVPEREYLIPLGKADVKRKGTDVTIVTWSNMVHETLAAASKLEQQGISVEVVDPRTLNPLDKKTIIDSVKKTGHVVIAHEANKTGGAGGEISAMLTEEAFEYLKAPVLRIATPDVPMPFSPPLEKHVVPDDAKIVEAVKKVLGR